MCFTNFAGPQHSDHFISKYVRLILCKPRVKDATKPDRGVLDIGQLAALADSSHFFNNEMTTSRHSGDKRARLARYASRKVDRDRV